MKKTDKSVRTTISGNANGVTIVGAGSTVTSTFTSNHSSFGNFQELADSLMKHGVERSEVDELKPILEEEKSDAKEIGPKTKSWIERVIHRIKTNERLKTFAGETTAVVLAECIAHYCGWI